MEKFVLKYEVLLVIAAMTLAALSALVGFDFAYKDTDNYMRALRIIDLINTKEWSETLFLQSNYPFGEVLHWTRLVDVLWIGMALPLFFVLDVRDSIFYAGMYFSPIIAVLTAVAIVYALRPYTSLLPRIFALVVFAIQMPVHFIFAWGRPDHHSLLALLAVVTVGLILGFLKDKRERQIVLAGVLCGLMSFIAAEGLLFTFLICAAFGLFWLWWGEKGAIDTLISFTAAFLGTITLAVLVNPPFEGYGFADNGRLSVLQVTIAGLGLLALMLFKQLNLVSFKAKTCAILCAGVVIAGIVLCLFGKGILISPIDAYLYEIWGHRVSELRSVLTAVDFFIFLFVPLISLGVLWELLRKQAFDKKVLVFIAVLLLGYTMLTAYAVRFAVYAAVLAVFPLALFVGYRLKVSGFYKSKKAPVPDSVMGFMLMVFFAALLCPDAALFASLNEEQIMNSKFFANEENNKDEQKVDIFFLYPFLAGRDGAVLTDAFLGPEVMWNTGRKVVGTPYHRNREGIIDTHKIFFATDMNEAKKLLLKHKVTDLFLPLRYDDKYYKDPKENTDKLYGKIYTGEGVPSWLVPVPEAKTGEKSGFMLYRVNLF